MNTFTLDEAAQLLSTYGLFSNMTILIAMIILVGSNVVTMIWFGCYRDHRMHVNHVRSGHMTEDEAFAEDLRKSRVIQQNIARSTFSSKKLSTDGVLWAGLREERKQHCQFSEAADSPVVEQKERKNEQQQSLHTKVLADEFQEVSLPELAPIPRRSGPSVAWPFGDNEGAGTGAGQIRTCQMAASPLTMTGAPQQSIVRWNASAFTSPRIAPQPRHVSHSTLLPSPPTSPAASGDDEPQAPAPSNATRDELLAPMRMAFRIAATSVAKDDDAPRHLNRAMRLAALHAQSAAAETLEEYEHGKDSIFHGTSSEGRSKRQERLQRKCRQLEELKHRRMELRRAAGNMEAKTEAEELLEDMSAGFKLLLRHVSLCLQMLRGFCRRMYENLRSEHTLVSFVAPMDEEEGLSRVQCVQVLGADRSHHSRPLLRASSCRCPSPLPHLQSHQSHRMPPPLLLPSTPCMHTPTTTLDLLQHSLLGACHALPAA